MSTLFVTSNRLWGKVTTYQRPGSTAFAITGQPMFVDRLQDPQTGPFDSIFYRVADFGIAATFGASVVAKFSGAPNSLGTLRFDAITYTSQQTLDNAIPYQFFRGGNALAAAESLSAAVNALDGYAGSAYSTATTPHPTCSATYVDNGDNTASVMVSYKTVGEAGNLITAEDHMTSVSLSSKLFSGGLPVENDLIRLENILYRVSDVPEQDMEGGIHLRLEKKAL